AGFFQPTGWTAGAPSRRLAPYKRPALVRLGGAATEPFDSDVLVPPGERIMKAAKGYAGVRRGLILGGIALAAGLGAALLLAGHVRDRVQQIEAQSRLAMVDRIVAARSLPAGTRLASDHLAVRPFPAEWVG